MKTLALSIVQDSVEEINQLHAELNDLAKGSIEKAIRIGELLRQQRAQCKHGEWLPWLETNVQFSRKTADRYQHLYHQRVKLVTLTNLNEAYRISLPKGQRKRKPKELKPLTPEEAAAIWLTFLKSRPEIQWPSVARAAFAWTQQNHVVLGDIEIKYRQSRTVSMHL